MTNHIFIRLLLGRNCQDYAMYADCRHFSVIDSAAVGSRERRDPLIDEFEFSAVSCSEIEWRRLALTSLAEYDHLIK